MGARIHGEGYYPNRTQEYEIWAGIKKRCLDPKCRAYPAYGGRGIQLCDRWRVYENFLADMGRRPGPEYSIERRDNNGPYDPNNCYWATRTQQSRNRRDNKLLKYKGQTYVQAELVEKFGLIRERFAARLKRGWTVEEAVDTPFLGQGGARKAGHRVEVL